MLRRPRQDLPGLRRVDPGHHPDHPAFAAASAVHATRRRRSPPMSVLMQAQDVTRHYPVGGAFGRKGTVKAVDGVSFELREGETLAVVGESGCGKSTLARIATLLEPPTSGTLAIDGRARSGTRRPAVPCGSRVQMVFQNPYGSLNPRKHRGRDPGGAAGHQPPRQRGRAGASRRAR